jgi:5-formyltetrahydrofolate cyclo-ligase
LVITLIYKIPKTTIRKEVLRKRDELSSNARVLKNSLIRDRLFSLPEFIGAETVLFYASFRSEVETINMIKDSLKMGKRVVLPKVDKRRHLLVLFEIMEMSELNAGYMGIPEPSLRDERAVNIYDIDIAIIPGVAFDSSGNRLGYGAGYYDILLSSSKKIPVVALAYEEQIVDFIPAENHDVKMDLIITDNRVIRIP